MAYQPLLTRPSSTPRQQQKWTSPTTSFLQSLSQNFSLTTILLTGALLQSVLLLLIPTRHALLPSLLILLLRLTKTLLITLNLLPNPYLTSVIPGRVTAMIPTASGTITGPSSQRVAILLLGAKSNHPLGLFAPAFTEVGDRLFRMNDSFESPETCAPGYMGGTSYERKDERGAREFVYVSYWRSIEDLHAFAHSGLHRDTWLWWERNLKRMDAVGINHEIFLAEPGAWENVYVNFQPTGLGATSFLRKGEKGELVGGTVGEEWIHPLVDARRGKLAKSSGRLGWDATRLDAVRPGAEVYGTGE